MNINISEKAIWEGSISPDDETSITASQMQTQPQMMFCYKCNNVIPIDSKFCPYCQINLFAECPKCGTKYSSQYPACNQCGTNREEYLRVQRREQERKEAIERENRRKRLEEERRRKEAEAEKERQERLKKYEEKASERRQKEAYIKENEEIKKTKEYKETYSILTQALKALANKQNNNSKKAFLLHSLIYIYLVISYIIDLANSNMELFTTIGIILFLIGMIGLGVNSVHAKCRKWQEEFLMQYALSDSRYRESLISTYLISMVWYQRNVSDCCIIEYRKKYGLPINYKWHSLR